MQRWLFVLLGFAKRPLSDLNVAWRALWGAPALRTELVDLLEVLAQRTRWLRKPLEGRLATLPFELHAHYSVLEALAALGEVNASGAIPAIREGTYFSKPHRLELLFVTLEKAEQDYTPTTLYDDYPISPSRFHWQSQSRAHEETIAGRRYLAASPSAPEQVLLLIRERQKDDRGETMTYVNLGPVTYRSHTGRRPMSIEWELVHPMPMWLFQQTKRAAG
jgi:hypothetical protein